MKPLQSIRVFFNDLFSSYFQTVKNYPLAILGSLILFIGMLGAFENWNSFLIWDASEDFWGSIMLSGLSVIPVGVIAGLAFRLFRKWWVFLVALLVIIFVSWIYFSTPWGYEQAGWLKVPHLILIFLLASLLPSYWYEQGQFWFVTFDRRILFRSILGYIFSMVFYGGLALGLAAIDTLFQLDINEDWYAYMGFAAMAIVFPGYIMSGLPWDAQGENEKDYTKVTHYIARFLLIPFTAGYLLILYAYFVRQLILAEWPEGWIGPLSIGLSVLAIYTKYITEDLAEIEWNGFEKWIRKIIFPALIIVGIAVMLAIFRRVDDYGWTEARWAGMLSGFIIAIASAYYSIRSKADLRHGVWFAFVIIILNWYGPLSGSTIALNDQIDRLVAWEDNIAMSNLGDQPWEELSDEQKTDTKEFLEFFKDRAYWAELEQHSYLWSKYRDHRGKDELPEDSWKALVKAFPRKIFRSKEVMDWASEERVWLDSTFKVPPGQYMTLTSMVRSRNEFGPWTFNWGTRPEVIYEDDNSTDKINLKPQMDSLISLHPMYYRYGVDELPCIQVRKEDKFIKLCFTELEVRFVSGDTLYYPEEVMLWTNATAEETKPE
jgi:hypothetical protein